MTALDALSFRVDPGDAIRDIRRISQELRELKREAREAQASLRGTDGPGRVGGFGGGGFGGGGFGPGSAFLAGAAADRIGGQFTPRNFTVVGGGGGFDGGGSGSPFGPRGQVDPGLGRRSTIVPGLGGLSAGRLAGAGLALGGALAIREATQDFIRFEDAQARLIATSERTRGELGALFDAVEQGALQTRFSVTEANAATEVLLRNGLNPDQAAIAINPTLRFAQATSTPVQTSARAATVAANIFGLGAEGLPSAFNQIAVADTSAATNASLITSSLSFGGGDAREAGLDLAEALTLVDLFAQGGAVGSRGGTALRAFSAAFGPQLRELGGDATQLLRRFREQGVGAEELRSLGLRATAVTPVLSAINNLERPDQPTDGIRIEAAIRSASERNVVDRRFAVTDDTLGADLDRLGAAFENFTNDLIENSDALDVFRGGLNRLSELLNRLSGGQPSPPSDPQQALDRRGLENFRVSPVELQNPPQTLNIDVQRFVDDATQTQAPTPVFDRLIAAIREQEQIEEQRREFLSPITSFISGLDLTGFGRSVSSGVSGITDRIASGARAIPSGIRRLRNNGRAVEAEERFRSERQAFLNTQRRGALQSTLGTGLRIAQAPQLEGRAIQLAGAFGLDDTNPEILGETIDQLERIQDLDRLRGSIDSLSDGFRGFFSVLRESGDASAALSVLLDSLTNAALNQFVFGQGALLGPGGPVLGGLFNSLGQAAATPSGGGGGGFFNNINSAILNPPTGGAAQVQINVGDNASRLSARAGNSRRQGRAAGLVGIRR